MKYSVKVRNIVDNGKPLKATCSVTLDGQFAVHGVKVIQTGNERFIAMPSETYTDSDGAVQFRDVCHPTSNVARSEMTKAVLDAYDEFVASNPKQSTDSSEKL